MNAPMAVTPGSAGARKNSRWRTVLWLLLALCVVVLVAAFTALDRLDAAPLLISVNGVPVTAFDLAALPPAHKVALALAGALVLPVALFVALGGVAVALVALVPIVLLAVVLPLLIGGLLVALLLSPFALLVWLLWRAVRPAGPRGTTIPA